jgi:hypothetical protein
LYDDSVDHGLIPILAMNDFIVPQQWADLTMVPPRAVFMIWAGDGLDLTRSGMPRAAKL